MTHVTSFHSSLARTGYIAASNHRVGDRKYWTLQCLEGATNSISHLPPAHPPTQDSSNSFSMSGTGLGLREAEMITSLGPYIVFVDHSCSTYSNLYLKKYGKALTNL